MSNKLIITGDSHANSMGQMFNMTEANEELQRDDVIVKALGNGFYLTKPFFQVCGSELSFTYPEYKNTFEEFRVGNINARKDIIYGFSMGLNSPPAFRNPIWKKYAPWVLSEELNLPPLPHNIMEIFFMQLWKEIRRFFQSCIDTGVDFFVISGPPPKANHTCIQDGISPKAVVELDKLYRKSTERWLQEKGINYIKTPSKCCDSKGFLKKEFYHPHPQDETHGNKDFGGVMLSEILKFYDSKYGC